MPTDLEKLQGTWHVSSLEADGQQMPADAFDGSTMVVEGNTFRSLGALETLERGDVVRKAKNAKAHSQAAGGSTTGAVAERHGVRSGAPTAWEGEWAMVAAVLNGVAMGQDMVKWCQRITRGDITSVVAGPQVMLKARFTLDHSTAPPAVDYVNLAGGSKGKTQAGIFELSGDTLSVCMAAPGQPRPHGFSSKAGDGRSYTTWRRVGG